MVQGLSDIVWESDGSYDDRRELKTLVAEHSVKEVEHLASVLFSFDLVDFQMSLFSDQDSQSLSDGSF